MALPSPRPQLRPLVRQLVVAGLGAGCLAAPALAQQQGSTQRVEITGSSIKGAATQGALPVQVISRQEIERQGISTAEQLISVLAANGAGLDNMVSNQGGDFLNGTINSGRSANNGASSASLRGLGPQNTLVLLNGRRLAAHGLNGKSVDLNSIPFAAIERVEVLKDGASAVYGSDAIGGVINFILRRDYQGLQAGASTDITEEGGGNIYRANVLWGLGSLDEQGFNVMATLAYDKNTRLRGNQRSFHNGYQPERGLAPDTTGTPFATINAAAGTALPASFRLPGDPTLYNRVNALALTGSCNQAPNTYAYRGDVTGFPNNDLSCAYDYGKDWSLMQPVERVNLVARGTWKLNEQHSVIGEVTGSRVKSAVEYTPNQITTAARGANYPVGGPFYLNLATLFPTIFKPTNTDPSDTRVFYDANAPIRLRWRCLECGPRQQDTTTDTWRVLVGMEGTLAQWDYKWGLSTAGSTANTVLGDGNLYEAKFKAAMDTGLINPFLRPGQSQTPEAMALIEGAKARGVALYGGGTRLREADFTVSGEVAKLPAGPLQLAVGGDLRKENFFFREDQSGQPAIIGVSAPASLPRADRTVKAVFAELAVPIVKNLDAQVAVRHDRYSDFGNTTNPKVALRWQPVQPLLLRASYGRGFHAPDFDALYAGETDGQFNSDVNDPVLCPDPAQSTTGRGCNIRPGTKAGGNRDLKPEKSKQWSAGFVVSPAAWASFGIDFWQVQIDDRIGTRDPRDVLANYAALSQYVVRDAAGDIDYVRGGFINVAGDKVRGADLSVALRLDTGGGRFDVALDGTYIDSYKSRQYTTDPWTELAGRFGDSTFGYDLKLRWKHTLMVTYTQGPWSTTLTQNFKSGYRQEEDGFGSGVVPAGKPQDVDSYTLYNLTATYTGIRNLSLTAGVRNLFNTSPPFSAHNVDNVAGAGWDARVGDPRGRSYVLGVNYKFY